MSTGYIGTIVVGDLNDHHKRLLKIVANVYVEGTWLFRLCEELGDRDWSWIHFSDVDMATLHTGKS